MMQEDEQFPLSNIVHQSVQIVPHSDTGRTLFAGVDCDHDDNHDAFRQNRIDGRTDETPRQ
jgi:hypothetical protein